MARPGLLAVRTSLSGGGDARAHGCPGCLQLFNNPNTLAFTQRTGSPARDMWRNCIVPDITTDIGKAARDVAAVARDAAYVLIGASVLGLQRLQVQRRELEKRMSDPRSELEQRLSSVRADFGDTVQATEARFQELVDRLEDVIEVVEAAIAPLEERLPDQARDIAKQAHAQAREARSQLRTLIPGAA